MNRSIILAALIISATILLNGYLERAARSPQAVQTAQKQTSPAPHEKSIAVLPFQDFSSSEQDGVGFAGDIQQEVINRLTKVRDLKVASADAVKQYKPAARDLRQVAGELGVANLLEGTVQHAANRVRVTVQLIDARTDATLWAERYDHELADVFAVESDIAKTIARELGARLSPAEEAAIAAGGGHP